MIELRQTYDDLIAQMLTKIDVMHPTYIERMRKRAERWADDLGIIWDAAEKKRKRDEEVITKLDDAIEREVDTTEEIAAVEEVMEEIREIAKDERHRSRLQKILGAAWKIVYDKDQVR